MIDFKEDRYRLTIPLPDAIRFVLGLSDLSYPEPSEELRLLAVWLGYLLISFTSRLNDEKVV
jgi:hypothetical protein